MTDFPTGSPADDTAATSRQERCLVLHPALKGARGDARTPQARLDEAMGLAHAIDLQVVEARVVPVARARPATLFGSGTVQHLGELVADLGEGDRPVGLVVVDGTLTPVQQRNLERAWKCKVVDRTGLILEIFGARARTREGTLQVELAALTYARSRLVRSWTHLERQRGGLGFVGGPGETQIETDRRLIGERIARLRKELKEVKRTRELHRAARRKVPFPIVALVGYTNAGKSTLFNRLTRARVHVEDQVFATLDPTMRRLELPAGRTAILSDTVGFISDLPHELVDAFHATLEEVCEADLLVHVRDISHPDTEDQKQDVHQVLTGLGLERAVAEGMVEVANKIDLLDPEEREALLTRAGRGNLPVVPLSARTGAGCGELLAVVERRLAAAATVLELTLPFEDGATLAWLHDHGEVLEQAAGEDAMHVTVRLDPAQAARFEKRRPAGQ
ncbi:MAG: GTPase HflX [Hyphomicrobiales bacterium]|nr:GTPase HflX [Hyphomicrobiales bacterium]